MNSPGNALPLIYLKSGEIHYSADPENVYTVLGSCLSVTMLHRPSGTAAICHGVMPECRIKGGCGGACPEPGKYVDCAIRSMTKRFSGLGVSPRELEVKVFGGAATFTRRPGAGEGISVGKRNTAAALAGTREGGAHHRFDGRRGCVRAKNYFQYTVGRGYAPAASAAGDPGGPRSQLNERAE